MSRNGSGTYNLPAGNPVVTGNTISSSWANTTLSDIASALTGSIAADGQTTPTANLVMGTYAHTGVGNATARTMYASAGQVQDSVLTYLTSVAGTNAITASAPIVMTAYATGQTFRFIAANASTGAVTININSIGLKSIVRTDGSALSSGDIASGAAVQIMYDGTNFQLLSDANGKTESVTNLTVTGTLTANNDASISGLTVGKGGGAVATNTAVGASAMVATSTGDNNSAFGANALNAVTSGKLNTAIGSASMFLNTSGENNTGVGVLSFRFNTTGSNNTAVGTSALYSNTTASNNTAVGFESAYSTTTGEVTAIGTKALYANTTGDANTAVGYVALTTNTTGANNTGIGRNAVRLNTTGSFNTGLGSGALYNNTTASNNTAVGYQAAYTGTTGLGGSAHFGYQAGYTSNGFNNSFGYQSLYTNTSGASNDAFGFRALYLNTTGASNVAIGDESLRSNTTASNNTAVGYQAGYSNTGTQGVFIGGQAGYATTTANGSTHVGYLAGYSVTTGSYNALLGQGAGYYITTGAKNTIVGGYNGNQGGLDIRTANNKLVLSDGDGNPLASCGAYPSGSGTYGISVRGWTFGQGGNSASQDGVIYLNGSVATNYGAAVQGRQDGSLAWIVGTYATVIGGSNQFLTCSNTSGGVYLNGASATAWTAVSDERLKENFEEITNAASKVSTLRAVIGNYTFDEEKIRRPFLIAQDLQAVLPEAVTSSVQSKEDDTEYLGVAYTEVIPLLVAAIKELKAEIDLLKGTK